MKIKRVGSLLFAWDEHGHSSFERSARKASSHPSVDVKKDSRPFIAPLVGAFTGLAAFFGGLMNWSFIMAGPASTNGMLFAIATWLVLAWRNAGWIGLDLWLLPLVGTPWKRGRLFRRLRTAETT